MNCLEKFTHSCTVDWCKLLFLSTPPTAAPCLSSSLSPSSIGDVSDSTCAGALGRDAAEILTPLPHDCVRHTPAMDREELWETDAGRGKEGDGHREGEKRETPEPEDRGKEREGAEFRVWRVWPCCPVEPGSQWRSLRSFYPPAARWCWVSESRYRGWRRRCWRRVCWVRCFVR